MFATIGHETVIEEIVADKGYYSAEAITACVAAGKRTYFPPKKVNGKRRWKGKPAETKRAILGNDRRARGDRGKGLTRQRGEKVERTFAHVCDTGGARRTWLRGFEKVRKRYLITVAAHNLGRLMLALFGIGKPKSLQAGMAGFPAFSVIITQFLISLASLGHWAGRVSRFVRLAATPKNLTTGPMIAIIV